MQVEDERRHADQYKEQVGKARRVKVTTPGVFKQAIRVKDTLGNS
jgi:hypothetical protein